MSLIETSIILSRDAPVIVILDSRDDSSPVFRAEARNFFEPAAR
jgi:hypothetical protein